MSRPALRQIALAALFFAAATILFTWPIAAHVGNGLADLWDAKLTAWILRWDYHALFHDPASLFDANIFYPARYALTFSENLLGVAVFGFPLYAAGVSTLAVYNFLFLLGMFLSAMGAWALARDMTGDSGSALLAGVIYAYLPWRIAHIAHIQFQWGGFLCVLLLFLLRYLRTGRPREALLFGLFLCWNALSNIHYALFSGLLIGVVLAWELLTGGDGRYRRGGIVLAVSVVCGAALLPVFIPYWRASDYYGVRRGMEEIAFYSGRPMDFLRTGAMNRLYGRLSERWPHPESEFFPGLLPIALAAYSLLRVRTGSTRENFSPPSVSKNWRRIAVRVCDALVLVAIVLVALSLAGAGVVIGPVKARDPGRILVVASALLVLRLVLAVPGVGRPRGLRDVLRRLRVPREATLLVAIVLTGVLIALGAHTPYYRFLVQSFAFLFAAIRVPARGIVLFDLGLAVLAAWGLQAAISGSEGARRFLPISAVLVLIAIEYRAFPLNVSLIDPAAPPVYRWLASNRSPGAVMEWPLGREFDSEYVFRSAEHWHALVNGASGFYPPTWVALADVVARNPIPSEVWAKVPRGTRVLILHAHDPQSENSLARFGGATEDALRAGRIDVIGEFRHGHGTDYVFRLTREGAFNSGLSTEMQEQAKSDFAAANLRRLPPAGAPFGMLDSPAEGAVVRTGEWAFGWALDDSGISAVLVSLDGGTAAPAITGLPHPGIREAYPQYPATDRAGFGFSLPALQPGPHVLSIVFHARDGGIANLKRTIQAR